MLDYNISNPNNFEFERVSISPPAFRPLPSPLQDCGEYKLLSEFRSNYLRLPHDIVVWLPPQYNTSPTSSFPVLYAHDGQNIFEGVTFGKPSPQRWGLDSTITELIKNNQLPPVIIVGIESTDDRLDEYTHIADKVHGGGKGAEYERFLIEELKPLIDQSFRTKPDPSNTALIGSSLGGLVSLYMGFKHPEIFGRVAALSVAWWWSDNAVFNHIPTNPSTKAHIILSTGTLESKSIERCYEQIAKTEQFSAQLKLQGGWQEGKNLYSHIFAGGQHTEEAWNKQLPLILQELAS